MRKNMLNLKKNSDERKNLRERIIKLTKEYVENFGINKKSDIVLMLQENFLIINTFAI